MIFLLLLAILSVFTQVCGSGNAYEMLKAAENGNVEKVLELINEKGVTLDTKNNYGVR